MQDPRHHVRPGQKLRIAAEQINFLNGLMHNSGGFQGGPLATWAAGSNVVFAKNNTGGNVPRWGVVEVGGLLVSPFGGSVAQGQFGDMPCVLGVLPSCDENTLPDEAPSFRRIGVAVEPIAEDKIGRIAVSGVTQVRLNRLNNEHSGAKPVKGEVGHLVSSDEYGAAASILWCDREPGTQLALVTLAPPTGPLFRLGRTTDYLAKGTIGTVQVYSLGTPLNEEASDPDQFVNCANKFADVPGGRWVMVGYVNGRWYLVAAEC